MTSYDPSIAPEPQAWLALDEHERFFLIEVFHRKQRSRPPNLRAHAVFHAIVENQLAEGVESVVRAMRRLTAGGLTRHDALHAIASVLAEEMQGLLADGVDVPPEVVQSRYDAALEKLTAAQRRRLCGAKK